MDDNIYKDLFPKKNSLEKNPPKKKPPKKKPSEKKPPEKKPPEKKPSEKNSPEKKDDDHDKFSGHLNNKFSGHLNNNNRSTKWNDRTQRYSNHDNRSSRNRNSPSRRNRDGPPRRYPHYEPSGNWNNSSERKNWNHPKHSLFKKENLDSHKNIDFFNKAKIINDSDVDISYLMNTPDYMNTVREELSKTIKQLCNMNGYNIAKKKGWSINYDDKEIKEIKEEIDVPIVYVLGGASYQLISDMFAPEDKKIEKYCPVTYDYDITLAYNDKLFYNKIDAYKRESKSSLIAQIPKNIFKQNEEAIKEDKKISEEKILENEQKILENKKKILENEKKIENLNKEKENIYSSKLKDLKYMDNNESKFNDIYENISKLGKEEHMLGQENKIYYEQINKYSREIEIYVNESDENESDKNNVSRNIILNKNTTSEREDVYIDEEFGKEIKKIFKTLVGNLYDLFKDHLEPIRLEDYGKIDKGRFTPYYLLDNQKQEISFKTKSNEKKPVIGVWVFPRKNGNSYVVNFRVAINVSGSKNNHILEFIFCDNMNTNKELHRFYIDKDINDYKGFDVINLKFSNYELPIINIKSLISEQIQTIYDRNIFETKKGKTNDSNVLYSKCKKDYMRVKYICALFLGDTEYEKILGKKIYDLLNTECLFFNMKFHKPHDNFAECKNIPEFPVSFSRSIAEIINNTRSTNKGGYYDKYMKYKQKYMLLKQSM